MMKTCKKESDFRKFKSTKKRTRFRRGKLVMSFSPIPIKKNIEFRCSCCCLHYRRKTSRQCRKKATLPEIKPGKWAAGRRASESQQLCMKTTHLWCTTLPWLFSSGIQDSTGGRGHFSSNQPTDQPFGLSGTLSNFAISLLFLSFLSGNVCKLQ